MRKNGFTLLELIIVIVILGILATFAVPRYFRQVERARGTTALQLIGTLRSGQMILRAESGAFTAVCANLDVDFATPVGFAAPVCVAAPAAPTEAVVSITRIALPANPIAAADLYTLALNVDGSMCCTGGGGGSCVAIAGANSLACP